MYTMNLEVCHNPTNSPREWEVVQSFPRGEGFSAAEARRKVVDRWEHCSHAFRCGKAFRVTWEWDGTPSQERPPQDIYEFVRECLSLFEGEREVDQLFEQLVK